jgi:hypothetical protein
MEMHIRRVKTTEGEYMGLYKGEQPRFAGFGMGLGPDPAESLLVLADRTEVETLADIAEEQGAGIDRWWQFIVASGAKGKPAPGEFSRWHVLRFMDGPGISGENLQTPTGRVKTFPTREAAQKAANKANELVNGAKRFHPLERAA